METRKHKAGEYEPELACPKCHVALQRLAVPKELISYSEWLLPQCGDLESCNACGTVLEYISGANRLLLKISSLDALFEQGKKLSV
jgi:hypothetical protein